MHDARRATILVVDDDAGVREALHLILEDDYEVLDAVDSGGALAILAARTVDLILLDLIMEHSDGFEMLERRSGQSKDVPIIIVSGLNNAWTAAAAMRLGAVDYVTKPFDENELHALIRDPLTSGRQAPAESRQRGPRIPLLLLVGLDLGLYASLAVLLRQHCRVARAETVFDALNSPGLASTTMVALDPASSGLQDPAVLAELRRHFADAQLVLVGLTNGLPGAHKTLIGPARVTYFLNFLTEHLTTNGCAYGDRTRTALDYLGTDYIGASIRRLARVVGTSPKHLSTCFREETGIPLKGYIAELRVEAAKWLLAAGEKIEAAAVRVGLHDASHLSKLFVRYAGSRPGAYRRTSLR